MIMNVVIDVGGDDILVDVLYHLDDFSWFFSSIADIFVLLCLVELAVSFLKALGNDSTFCRIVRYSDFVVNSILLVLAVAGLGEGEAWVTNSNYGLSNVSWVTTGNLYGAYNVIYWTASLAVVFLSIFVLYSSIRKKHMRSVSKAPCSCSLLLPIPPVLHASACHSSLFQIYL
jgi:hypothetical protein